MEWPAVTPLATVQPMLQPLHHLHHHLHHRTHLPTRHVQDARGLPTARLVEELERNMTMERKASSPMKNTFSVVEYVEAQVDVVFAMEKEVYKEGAVLICPSLGAFDEEKAPIVNKQ